MINWLRNGKARKPSFAGFFILWLPDLDSNQRLADLANAAQAQGAV